MKYLKYVAIACVMSLNANANTDRGKSCNYMTESDAAAAFEQWNNGLASGNSQHMASLYSEEAVLLPTVSNQMRLNRSQIADYFDAFLKKGPVGEIEQRVFVAGCNNALDTGIYSFSFADGSQARARYTYVHRYIDGNWFISHHHSSVMPE